LILAGYFFYAVVLTTEPFNKRKKQSQMKKFLFVAAIAAIGTFAACNNSASTEAKTDSTKTDSSKMMADSSKMSADSSKMAADSSKMAADTTKKK
jgi:outer membrane murein-binding lipoprotein Lpp